MTILKILGIIAIIALAVFLESPERQGAQLKPQPIANAFDKRKVYHFDLTVSRNSYPTIRGTTDIPDGTQLFVNVLKPHLPDGQQRLARGLPACEDDCSPANSVAVPPPDTIVQNGAFSAGPFTFNGKPFRPNFYPIRISVVPKAFTVADFDLVYNSEIWMPGR